MSDTFGFGENDANIGKKSKAWKAEAGKDYRASFAWWDIVDGKFVLEGSPKFTGAQVNYIKGVGSIVNKGPDWTKLAGEPPKQKILGIIVVWPTNKQGQVDKTRLTTDFSVEPWVFSGDKYNQLKKSNGEFPFKDHDLTISCSDAQFQKMTFTPCKESLLKTLQANEKAKPIIDAIVAAVQEIAANTQEYVGREMTVAAIREKLANGNGGMGGSNVGAGDASAAAGNIDSVVDDLLG